MEIPLLYHLNLVTTSLNHSDGETLKIMYLKPSEIFFSQDSINNVFDKNCGHRYQPIGETLDALCNGRCSIESIPTISVVKQNNKWFTADNRRLWVFRNLERLGKCSEIYVNEGYYIPSSKFTTNNGGVSVVVRNGSPGGYWHRRPSVKQNPVSRPVPVKTQVSANDDIKENIPIKPNVVDDTTNKANRSPFRGLDNVAFDIRDECENISTENIRAEKVEVIEPKDISILTNMKDNISKSFPLIENEPSSDKSKVSHNCVVVDQEKSIIKNDSCQVQVDEDNNEVINNVIMCIYEKGPAEADLENGTDNTVKKNNLNCIILSIVATVVIINVVIALIVFIVKLSRS